MSETVERSADPALLPSVDEMLARPPAVELISDLGRERVLAMVRSLIAEKRAALRDGRAGSGTGDRRAVVAELADKLAKLGADEKRSGVRRVINAAGVVLHTNLGRAPLSAESVAAMRDAAGYSAIEYDVASGSRGPRGPKAIALLKLLTGAEDALAVNNCAAAALLVLSTFAQGREVIVSRGELVEIGGDFRVPDILTRSGAFLREVGTTNRTHLRDYENAISDRTAMILKVHPSNFRITGFTKSPATAELAGMAKRHNMIFFEDAGSGAMTDLSGFGITGEPVIRGVIASGADLVSFSGDKLLGGPQAGIIVGRAELVGRLRHDPYYRALRLDKMITAALEATLETYLRGRAADELPVLKMLSASAEEIAERSRSFAARIAERSGASALVVELDAGKSAVGGGASPDAALGTTVIALRHPEMSEMEIESRLRLAELPVIARIDAGRVLIDLRTVAEQEEDDVLEAILRLG